jgi:hypothetical protein
MKIEHKCETKMSILVEILLSILVEILLTDSRKMQIVALRLEVYRDRPVIAVQEKRMVD